MSPDPEHPAAPDLEAIDHFFDNWCNLTWTGWIPFNATKQVFNRIPREPGLYRIRPVGKECLVYIGETKRTLRDRLHTLRLELEKSEQMPWSDPHTEAPALWAWREEWLSEREDACQDPADAGSLPVPGDGMRPAAGNGPAPETGRALPEGSADYLTDPGETLLPADPCGFECSAAPLDASDSGRRGMESFLLYRYRQENGESPLCSFGRFPPRYRRSTTKREGRRGGRLAEGQKDNPAGGRSQPPLCPSGAPGDSTWMGLAWSAPALLDEEHLGNVPRSQCLYLLLDAGSKEVIFIGRADDCAGQLAEQGRRAGKGEVPLFSYHVTGEPVLPHQLRELETDLIGNYYEQYRKAPELQFRGSSPGTRGPGKE
jgi:hypothetical protein